MKIRTLIVNKTMKKIILMCLFLSISTICHAEWNPLETVDEAKERKAHNEYEQRRNNPYGEEPFGGYQETLGGGPVSPYSSQSNNPPTVSKQSAYDPKPFETTDEQRERHRAERYEYRQKYGEPLGGYPEKLGDTEPYPYKSSYKSHKSYYSSDEDEE